MDWLLEVEQELSEAVYFATADLLNLEVDLLFFDTTSTYFERDEAEQDIVDEDGNVIGPAFRVHGKSKDSRGDLPQIVIGMAVTRSGIPIRVWCWPGNTGDQELIRQAKDDLRAWKLSRVVWVAERGFQSEENRRYLQRAGGHYILGEKLRGKSKEAKAALSRQGRYHTVAENLRVKEVIIDDGTMRDRFVICHNPEEAVRDKAIREQLLARIREAIARSDSLPASERHKLYGELSSKRGYKRLLRTTKGGLLRIDRAAVKAEAHLDGKFLLRSSDPTLSVEDIALGYKQLLVIERAWRDMKTTLDLRPIHHRKEDRIRAHVLLCWLALLLIRIAENQTNQTWCNLRDELQHMHLGTFTGPGRHQPTAHRAHRRPARHPPRPERRPTAAVPAPRGPRSRPPPSSAPSPPRHRTLDTRRTPVRHAKKPANSQVLAPSTSNELRNPGRAAGIIGGAGATLGYATMLPGAAASALSLVGIIGGVGLAIALAPVAETLFIASAVLILISAQKVMAAGRGSCPGRCRRSRALVLFPGVG